MYLCHVMKQIGVYKILKWRRKIVKLRSRDKAEKIWGSEESCAMLSKS